MNDQKNIGGSNRNLSVSVTPRARSPLPRRVLGEVTVHQITDSRDDSDMDSVVAGENTTSL